MAHGGRAALVSVVKEASRDDDLVWMTVSQGGEPDLGPLDGPTDEAASPTAADLTAAASPPGLASLHRMLDSVARQLDLRSLTVVVDDPDLGRQAFRAGPGPFEPGALIGEPGCRADPPLPPERIDPELLSALCAASLRVDVLRGEDAPGIDAAEVAFRRLPGVLAVVVERDEDVMVVQIHAGADAPDDLSRAAARAGAPLGNGAVVIEVLRASAQPAPIAASTDTGTLEASPIAPGIVVVRSEPETGEIEVHLRHGDVRTIGRAPASQGLAGAVEATLDALRQLAPDLELGLTWARTIETTADRRFVVGVALHHIGSRVARHGLGSGANAIEGAARAALDAALRPDEQPGA